MSADGAQGGGADEARPFQVGLLGHGNVGGAFAELLASRADEIERLRGALLKIEQETIDHFAVGIARTALAVSSQDYSTTTNGDQNA